MHLIDRDEALALLGVNEYRLRNWVKKGYLTNEAPRGKSQKFNKQRIERIADFADDEVPTMLHAELCYLEWIAPQENRKGKRQIQLRLKALLAKKIICTTTRTAELCGYANGAAKNWVRDGTLRAVKIGKTHYILMHKVMALKEILDSYTIQEAAEFIGVSRDSILNYVKYGQLEATKVNKTIGYRFSLHDLQALKDEREEKARKRQQGVEPAVACKRLGVARDRLSKWAAHGALRYWENGTRRYYQPEDIDALEQQQSVLNPEFQWLEADSFKKIVMKVVARKCSIAERTVLSWAEEGLLPFVVVSPPVFKRSDRQFLSEYIDALVVFARGKPITKSLLIAFYDKCKLAGGIVQG